MIGAFVLLIVRAGESILVALFLVGACSTGVPIFNVETARETDILVGKMLYDIRVSGVLDAILLCSRWNVWYDSVVDGHERRLKRGWDARNGSTRRTTAAVADAWASVVGSGRTGWGPLLRVAKHRDAGWHVLTLGCRQRSVVGIGCCGHHRKLLHHACVVRIALGLVRGHLLDGSVENSGVSVVRCR